MKQKAFLYLCLKSITKPNDFDKIFRENLDDLLPYIARKLLGLDLSRTEILKDKVQITLEREADSFRKVLHDDPLLDYGVHWEFQSTDEDMQGRNLFYYLMLRRPAQRADIFVVLSMPLAFGRPSGPLFWTHQNSNTGPLDRANVILTNSTKIAARWAGLRNIS